MTHPTPLSTASSSDDLVERLSDIRLILDGVTSGYYSSADAAMHAARSVLSDIDDLIADVRQPVAGDVVEREKHIGWLREQIKPCAIEMKPGGTEIYMMFITSDRAEKFFEKLQDALFDMPFKLIGGGK